MSILINGMEMPTSCYDCSFSVEAYEGSGVYSCVITDNCVCKGAERHDDCPLIPVPDHGRLIDADEMRAKMYHEAFETDTPMQKWDSGCWIRYKMFERMVEAAPTIIPADKEGEG